MAYSLESIIVDIFYGEVHAIASGPEDAPPALLLHYGGMSASVWLHNIEGLSWGKAFLCHWRLQWRIHWSL